MWVYSFGVGTKKTYTERDVFVSVETSFIVVLKHHELFSCESCIVMKYFSLWVGHIHEYYTNLAMLYVS
jgi:hypothetical protein